MQGGQQIVQIVWFCHQKKRFQFLKFQMYDKNAEVEISWGLFHKVNKLFQVTGKPHNSRLNQDARTNRTFTWEQLKLEVLVFFSFLISFTNTFLKPRAKNYNCSHWYFRGLYPMKMNLYPCKLEQLKKSYKPLLLTLSDSISWWNSVVTRIKNYVLTTESLLPPCVFTIICYTAYDIRNSMLIKENRCNYLKCDYIKY